ncbi:MAG: MFS transporter [Gaiellaceae bacterium]
MSSRVIAFLRDCRPSLPRAVWIIQAGNVVNFFGFGLVLPFELIYLHDRRGFALPTSGLIVSTVMAVNVLCAGPAGSLADRFGGKRLLFFGASLSGLGYGSLAFVAHPWEGFLASTVAGLGAGCTAPAAGALITALTTREERVAAFTVARISVNLGIGAGGVVAGLIVASGSLRSFQILYLLNGATFFGYLAFLSLVPNARAAPTGGTHERPRGYRFVLAHRVFLSVLAANFVFVVVGYTLFGYTMPIYARHHAHVGTQAIGAVFAANTIFIILFQMPIVRLSRRRGRVALLAVMCAFWGAACLVAIGAGASGSHGSAVAIFAVSGIAFGVGECLHAVVVQPLVSELAPPALVGRYMALFGMTFSIGLAVGPTASAAALAVSPQLPWLGGAGAMLVLLPLLAPALGRATSARERWEPAAAAPETVS